jgi:hypothetical protein
MIIELLNNKCKLQETFQRYYSGDDKYQYKLHVIATRTGFKNWEQFKQCIDSKKTQEALKAVESFLCTNDITMEAQQEGLHEWVEYMMELNDTNECYCSEEIIKLLLLYHYVLNADYFNAVFDMVVSEGYALAAGSSVLTCFNLADVETRELYRTFERYVADEENLIENVADRDSIYYYLQNFNTRLESGVRLLIEGCKRGHMHNQHVYSATLGREYYLKVYGEKPTFLMCDDDYPEGLKEICHELGYVYIEDYPVNIIAALNTGYNAGVYSGPRHT